MNQNVYQSNPEHTVSEETILSARIHKYQSPLMIDQVAKPVLTNGEQVLLKVGAAGLCHSDLHLINGEWKNLIPIPMPLTPGHEVAGWVEEIGDSVPKGLIKKGDLVAVFGGWGCGVCVQCKAGEEQLCHSPRWPGLSSFDGGFADNILVPSYRYLISVPTRHGLNPEELAPLTDAGLTPYRAIKKVMHTLAPGTNVAVIGIGGLGSYAIQYVKLLAPNSNAIAVDINDNKLELAERLGANYTLNLRKSQDIKSEVYRITEGKGISAIIDCVGTEKTIRDSAKMLAKGGILVIVGLLGSEITLPLAQSVINEYQVQCSLWGNYNELSEVIELAKRHKIKHNIQRFKLSEINDAIELLKKGQISGRGVVIPSQ